MRIGYPCLNTTLNCRSNRTFRVNSYSEKRLIDTVESNLTCLAKILRFNAQNDILFFRITSDLIPFASHPICKVNWQRKFRKRFQQIGKFITNQGMRISMHPGHFTVLNSKDEAVVENSIRELRYHAQVLDLMGLDISAKVQIHIGGVYNHKENSSKRFIERFEGLDDKLKRRLVIENDDSRYHLKDCLRINAKTDIPVVFDTLHHEAHSCGETIPQAFKQFTTTWKSEDGLPMVDYSSQETGERKGKHVETINLEHFRGFMEQSKNYDFDVMLEIKDKEKSAIKAVEVASQDNRFLSASDSK
ncbi:MAG: UV DNA damage repair endonuclease UvsE [Thermoproteota archaeon]